MASIDRILASSKIQSFGTASHADIDQYEKTYAVRFSRAYREYLEKCNGMQTDFDFDEVKEAGLHMALADITKIYGIDNGRDYADLVLITPGLDDNRRQLLKFAPPIGVGGDMCTFVEITQGKSKGQIIYTDGEMYWGYFDEAETNWDDPVDDLIAQFVEDGFFMPVADTFDELIDMYAKLV